MTKPLPSIKVGKKAPADGSANHKIMGDEVKMVFYFNRLSIEGRRNSQAKGLTEETGKSLISLLIKFYPTKAATVKKYLSKAGYTAKEMPFFVGQNHRKSTGSTRSLQKPP